MRRYGSTKRNPNPVWPGVQTKPVLPPDSRPMQEEKNVKSVQNDDIIKVSDREDGKMHQRDGLIPIMSYMTDSGMAEQPVGSIHNKKCQDMKITDYLCDKSGNYARVEFLFGENTHVEKTGVLESVGRDFVVLVEAGTGSRIVCMAKNIKFINIYNIK